MFSTMHAQICVMGAIGLSQREGLTKHDIEALSSQAQDDRNQPQTDLCGRQQ